MNQTKESSINLHPPEVRAWFTSTWNEIGAAIAAKDLSRWNVVMNEPRIRAFVDMGSEYEDEEYQLTRACVRGSLRALFARWPLMERVHSEDSGTPKAEC